MERLIDVDEKTCRCCRSEFHVMGEDVSERVDVVLASFRVLVTRRPRYGCRSCGAVPVQAPAPVRIVEGGMAISWHNLPEERPEELKRLAVS